MAGRRLFGTIEKRRDRPGYYVRFHWNGRRYKRTGGSRKRVAEQKLANTFALLERGWSIEETLSEVFGDVFGPRITFRQATEDYQEHSRTRKKDSTYERDVLRLRRTCKATWSSKTLGEIQARDIQKWLTQLQGEGLAGSTLNRYRAIVSAVFKWAINMGYVYENPVRRVEGFSESGRERETYLTAAEAMALLAAAEPLFRPILATALFTGARRAEILSLCWRDVDFKRRELVLQAAYSKTGKLRVIPLASELERELRALRDSRKTLRVDGAEPVFVTPDGSPVKTSTVRGMMKRAVERCDAIPADKKPKVTLHVLRHTFASLAAQNGVSFFELGKILGHSTPAMTARYSHFYAEGARAAVDCLGEVLSVEPDERGLGKSGT